MKTFHTTGLSILAALSLGVAARAADDDVISPAIRTTALGQAKTLLSAKERGAPLKDPFHSEAFTEALAASAGRNNPSQVGPESTTARTPVGPRSARDLLQAIAGSLKPRYLELGGKPILFFGQKRVKAGDSLTITFEGAEYTLEVVSIDRPNFTLRLNREEFTRTIK